MIHPWRILRSRPHLVLAFAELPGDLLGTWRPGVVTLTTHLLQVERRCVLMHELVHDERGMAHPALEAKDEAAVEREVARRLIRLADLERALRWSLDLHVVADELWVTVDVLEARLRALHPAERARLLEVLSDVHAA